MALFRTNPHNILRFYAMLYTQNQFRYLQDIFPFLSFPASLALLSTRQQGQATSEKERKQQWGGKTEIKGEAMPKGSEFEMKLTEPSAELMEIPAIATIAARLREMTFSHRLFSGCDYEEVLEAFAEVTYRYNGVIESSSSWRKPNASQPRNWNASPSLASSTTSRAPPFHRNFSART